MDNTKEPTLQNYLIAGGFGGICTTIIGHPFDTIKVRMQAVPGLYINTFDATLKILKHEGATGLYKGMNAQLIGIVPIYALSILSYESGKKLLIKNDKDEQTLKPKKLFLAGMFSGLTTTIFSVPGERIKCLLQMQNNTKKYNGFFDCIVKLLHEGGIKNLYVGTCATLLRDVPSSGFYFTVYEVTMRSIQQNTNQKSIWHPMAAGGLAGIANWIVAMPADVLKSRIQIAHIDKYPHGMRSAFREMMNKEGPIGFYRGILPIIIRSFPANAACFLGIHVAINFLDKFL